jgi:hypothetical protein
MFSLFCDYSYLYRFENQVFEFPVEQYQSDSVDFEVFDEDPGSDDFIGR